MMHGFWSKQLEGTAISRHVETFFVKAGLGRKINISSVLNVLYLRWHQGVINYLHGLEFGERDLDWKYKLY